MSSHLTPYVWRQILRNRPLSHAHCMRSLLVTQNRIGDAMPLHQNGGSRQIFGWSARSNRQVQPLRIHPGIKQLAQLDELLSMSARPPSNDKITSALDELFVHKHKTRTALLDSETHLALIALRHLLSQRSSGGELKAETYFYALQCLERKQDNSTGQETVALADLLFEQVAGPRHRLEFEGGDQPYRIEMVELYIRILCACRQAVKARNRLIDVMSQSPEPFQHQKFWKPILESLIEHGQEVEVATTLMLMKQGDVTLDVDLQLSVLRSFAQQGNLKAAEEWHGAVSNQHPVAEPQADAILLDMCIKHDMLAAGRAPFQRLLEHEPDKPTWDLILRWAAATGKGVDDVERMMEVMTRRNIAANSSARPDTATINGLLKLANSLKDPYRAERFISLAEKRGIALDGESFALQIGYRLAAGDVLGAYKAYQEMINYDVQNNIDILQIDSLIQKLCEASDQDMDAISHCVGTLNERKADPAPATVAALCKLHLHRSEIEDLLDLLHTHAFRLDWSQRLPLIEIFKAFIIDESTSAAKAWDAYSIMRQIFSEFDNETRTQIMLSFFKRKRSDHAIHVFGNMRQASLKEKRPSNSAYALCFQGIAHAKDEDSFHLVYNMLKLDSEIEPDTHVRNALMLAMVRIGLARRALEIWEDIVYSREGPTYNSITLVLYAIEETAVNADPDQLVWTRLQNFGVEPTKDNFAAYVGALCGQFRTDDAVQKVAEIGQKNPAAVDPQLLAILYNSSDTKYRSRVEEWAKQTYPTIWQQLQAIGLEGGEFKTKRTFKP